MSGEYFLKRLVSSEKATNLTVTHIVLLLTLRRQLGDTGEQRKRGEEEKKKLLG